MKSLGETIRNLREERQIPLRVVSEALEIDQAIISKIERGLRKPTKIQVIKLAHFYSIPENELLIPWLAENVLYEIGDNEIGFEVLKAAEEKLAYQIFKNVDRNLIIEKITSVLMKFPLIVKAWVFGSFARREEHYKSDVDLAVETISGFSYFLTSTMRHPKLFSKNFHQIIGQ